MKTESETPIMGSARFGPKYPKSQQTDNLLNPNLANLYIPAQAPPEPLDPWSAPLSFRDFLKLKKEVLGAYNEWLQKETNNFMQSEKGTTPWPEALQGLTREDIEILKL